MIDGTPGPSETTDCTSVGELLPKLVIRANAVAVVLGIGCPISFISFFVRRDKLKGPLIKWKRQLLGVPWPGSALVRLTNLARHG
jgi:hypothetical protein